MLKICKNKIYKPNLFIVIPPYISYIFPKDINKSIEFIFIVLNYFNELVELVRVKVVAPKDY